jgi:SAM-dependent methyltransferase
VRARIEYEACPLCESAEVAFLKEEDCSWHAMYKPELPPTIRWMRCGACRHVFTEGYFTEEALTILFADAHEYQAGGNVTEIARRQSARMVEEIEQARSFQQGRWLDVGFGNGALLTTAEEFGWQVVGLDLREMSVVHMLASGFDCHILDITDYRPSEPFDVISMCDVLEHMPFPKPALARAHEILAPDGLLYVSTPNMESYVWREADKVGNPYWAEIEHYHNFGRRRLYALLQEVGFNPVRYTVSDRYIMGMQVTALKADRKVVPPRQAPDTPSEGG